MDKRLELISLVEQELKSGVDEKQIIDKLGRVDELSNY